MSVEATEPIAVITDYAGLIAAFRQRVIALNTGLESVHHVAGLPARYTTKLLGQRRTLGPMSFGAVLGALGLKLAVLPDDDALAKVRHRLPPRQAPSGERLQISANHSKTRRKRARELAAALMRLQKGKRRLRA